MAKSTATITPIGVTEWATLDEANKKYSAVGQYSIGLRLSTDEAEPLKVAIDRLATETYENAQVKALAGKQLELADPPYRDNHDGTITFPFRMSARKPGKKGGRQAPIVVSADSKNMRRDRIKRGGKVRVSYTLLPFNSGLKGVGVSLKLVGVQHIAHVDASYYGFVPVDAWAQPTTNEGN